MEVNPNRRTILNGSNYVIWRITMEDLLNLNNYYQPVFIDEKPEDMTDEKWDLFHRQVCGYINKFVDDSVLMHIIGETNARTLWNKLEELYAESSKLVLIKQLKSIKYRDGTSMMDHVSRFVGIVNQLAYLGVKIDDEIQGLWLLGTLPDSWDVFTMSVCISAPNDVITLDLVRNKLFDEEIRKKMQNLSAKLDATVIESRGMSKNKDREKRQTNRSKSRGRYGNVECYKCGRKGHIKRFCRD